MLLTEKYLKKNQNKFFIGFIDYIKKNAGYFYQI